MRALVARSAALSDDGRGLRPGSCAACSPATGSGLARGRRGRPRRRRAAPSGGSVGLSRRAQPSGSCALRRASPLPQLDGAQHLAHPHVLALLPDDLRQHAVLLRADLDVDLVRFQPDDRVAGLDRVAFVLQPLRDGRLDHRLAQGGHSYLARHLTPPPRPHAFANGAARSARSGLPTCHAVDPSDGLDARGRPM